MYVNVIYVGLSRNEAIQPLNNKLKVVCKVLDKCGLTFLILLMLIQMAQVDIGYGCGSAGSVWCCRIDRVGRYRNGLA